MVARVPLVLDGNCEPEELQPGDTLVPAIIDHGGLLGLGDDDHLQYLLLLGRGAGQSAIGGTAVGATLALRGSSDAGLGTIEVASPVNFGDVSLGGVQYSMQWAPTATIAIPYVGSTLRTQADLTITHPTFISSVVNENTIYRWGVNPGFALYTLFAAQPIHVNDGNFNLVQATYLFSGGTWQRATAGTSTAGTITSVHHATTLRASIAGAVMRLTVGMKGLAMLPTWSTVAGGTVDFGVIRAVHCVAPGPALFAPSAGTENITAYYGIDFNNITSVTSGDKVVVRSAMTDAVDRFFLQNNGGARSNLGGGDLLDCGTVQILADDISVSLGAAGDVDLNWNGTAFEWDPAIGPDMRWAPNAGDYWTVTGGATKQGLGFNLGTLVFGTPVADPATANYFVRFAGPGGRQPASAGVYSDVQWTANGLIDVNGLAMSEVNSFRVDPNVTVLNGGSVQDQTGIYVSGMGFPGSGAATRIQALRIHGRSRLDGLLNFTSITPAQIVANQNDYALAANNTRRYQMRMATDAARTITGIAVRQTGDTLVMVNIGAFNLVLSHQDVLSAASNRIISPSGVNYTIGPDESATLWHDDVSDRWRIEHGTGA